jgi:HK97 family phage major capsid protein
MNTHELQDAFQDYQKTVETYFDACDEKLEKADALTSEKVSKLEKSLGELESKMSKMKTVLARPLIGESKSENSAYHGAFMAYVKKGVDQDLANFEMKALSAGSEPDGGYLLPRETFGKILSGLQSASSFRSVANQVTINSDALDFIADAGQFGAGWVSEADARDVTDTAKLNKIRIQAHELYAEPSVTQKLLDDASMDVEQWVTQKIIDKFVSVEEDAFINGDGQGKPKGILSYAAGREFGKVERVKSGADASFRVEDAADTLIQVVYSLPSAFLKGATWVMNRATLAEIRKFKDQSGRYVWQPALQSDDPSTILGYPVTISEQMPNLAKNSLSVAFGNFTHAYTIVDREHMRMLRDPFTTKPYVKFYTTKRVGGDVTNFDAYKLIQFAA